MTQHIAQADGSGHIDVNGHVSPVSYHLTARNPDESAHVQVQVEVSAPRDWLLEKGFQSEAVLIRENGERITVHSEKHLSVVDPISIVLSSKDETFATENELGMKFPELAQP